MATIDSGLIANMVAEPRTLNQKKDHGRALVAAGTVALTAGEVVDNNIVRLARLRSSDSIKSIKIFNDDLDTNCTPTLTANVGLYKKDGTVVDEDCYATLVTALQGAVTVGTEVAFEARDINAIGNELWQDGGVSADPDLEYDVCITFSAAAATAAAGDISFIIEYMS